VQDRLRPPFSVRGNEDAFWVEDVAGARFGFTYYRDKPLIGTDRSERLSRGLAERTVKWVARMATAEAARQSDPALGQAKVRRALADYDASHPEKERGESYPTGFGGRKRG
jgi:hypothetical protein